MRQSATQTAMGSGSARAREYIGSFAERRLLAQRKADKALAKLRQQAAERGLDRLTMAEIDAIIGASRRERGLPTTRGENY